MQENFNGLMVYTECTISGKAKILRLCNVWMWAGSQGRPLMSTKTASFGAAIYDENAPQQCHKSSWEEF